MKHTVIYKQLSASSELVNGCASGYDDEFCIDGDDTVTDDDYIMSDDDFGVYDDDFLMYDGDEGLTDEEIKEIELHEYICFLYWNTVHFKRNYPLSEFYRDIVQRLKQDMKLCKQKKGGETV